jgi:hypothetical protein
MEWRKQRQVFCRNKEKTKRYANKSLKGKKKENDTD